MAETTSRNTPSYRVRLHLLAARAAVAALIATSAVFPRAAPCQDSLREATARISAIFSDPDLESWGLTVRSLRIRDKKRDQPIQLDVDRYADGEVRIEAASPWISGRYIRPAGGGAARIEIPHHGMVFCAPAIDELDSDEHLDVDQFVQRLLGEKAALPLSLFAALPSLVGASSGPADIDLLGIRLALDGEPGEVLVTSRGGGRVSRDVPWLRLRGRAPRPRQPLSTELREVPVDRTEFERTIFRGLRRGAQVLAPTLFRLRPPKERKLPHGEIRLVDGPDPSVRQVLALLSGTPEQIGTAHGELLGDYIRRTVDSTVHFVGLVESLRRGQWFLDVLRDARRRTLPFVPERHERELRALARSVDDLREEDVLLANIFPEYFHCSGFALFGRATVDGELYHGRVLDYMTGIGLQDVAVTFVVDSTEAEHRFVNVGFAGFIGSVTGLNERQVAIGEMGGGGRGKWDGTPMATLVRRGLEECDDLAAVRTLFADSPRTCEYYYVFSDGKGPAACGVSATPEAIEFLEPGAPHPELGEGIPDCVLLSADERLVELQRRVQDGHGTFDATSSLALMARPVAMKTNLHNVLFAPRLGKLWITVAGGDGQPAADRPAIEIDAQALFKEFDPLRTRPAPPKSGTVRAVDTIRHLADSNEVAAVKSPQSRSLLEKLTWTPDKFDVRWRPSGESARRSIVEFPSPRPRRDAASGRDDTVHVEWFHAYRRGNPLTEDAPAFIILHILDGRMYVARGIAAALSARGIHTFVMHLPGYGARGSPYAFRRAGEQFARMVQGASDARRTFDAVATLPGIDANRIGLQGTSLGGFVAALAAGIDNNFHTVCLALTGGDLPYLLTKGTREAQRVRQRLMSGGWSADQLLARASEIDPLLLADRLDPDRTWLWSARSDTVVPEHCARAFAEAAGLRENRHIWLTGDHYTAAVYLPQLVLALERAVRGS